ncbi:MAG: 3-isopropylmalate dehydratase small subunit [Desulfocapsaceae bacterium]|nr:3-isopropylmalate dehydratase small subunit [Desulfocapsaceae bacterium]
MEPFIRHTGIVAPFDRTNVDTDLIIPKQFLKSVQRSGFGVNLFDQLRYLDEGQPGMDVATRRLNPDFVLNQPRYQNATILLTRANFGCGSSREHAPWALLDFGFKVILAPSFADIFFNNCFKNGILPITLPDQEIDRLFTEVAGNEGFTMEVDLEGEQLTTSMGKTLTFSVEPYRKHCLLQGLDDIGLTLQRAEHIRAYEERRRRECPWLFQDLNSA